MLLDDYSPRALATTLRTYCRDKGDGTLETPAESNTRATYQHHSMLAKRLDKKLPPGELFALADLGARRLSTVAGRTRFLGGTEYSHSRAASQYNCSYLRVATVFDVVDAAWLLLNGCGVGFKPIVGTLHGIHVAEVKVIPSSRDASYKGAEDNLTEFPEAGVMRLRIGDSAKAWAKALGKLMLLPSGLQRLILDFSECRGSGRRLTGYGWICNGDKPLADAMLAILRILSKKAGELLDEIDILDIINHIGTILSSRRSAQITLLDAGSPRRDEFAKAKKEYWLGNNQRRQSNNTLQYWQQPSLAGIEEAIRHADACGGCPGIENASAAREKAPWFDGSNPCHEILLPSHGFCNLVTNCLPRFQRNYAALERAVHLIARANYRQTCVDLRDGILQATWHQTNEALRLCGVSLTGIVQADWLTDYQIRRLRNAAVMGAYSQADEWGLPRPKAVTTIKPEGTGSKTMGSSVLGEVTEGIHKPLGRYIFNWINFSTHDPLVQMYESAGYRVLPNPSDANNLLICFPVDYANVELDIVDGKEVNLESALIQLERYRRWNQLWADHTVSCTVSYSPEEIPSIAKWIYDNWDAGFIAVSLLRRNDPTKTAADLGHPYLPQEVRHKADYQEYVSRLKPLSAEQLVKAGFHDLPEEGEECAGGACPVR